MYRLNRAGIVLPHEKLTEYNTLKNTTSYTTTSATARKWVTTFTLDFSILQYLDLEKIMNPYGTEVFKLFKTYNYDNEVGQEKANFHLPTNHVISVNRKLQQRYQLVFSDYYTDLFPTTTP